jgi:hypothetical protein
MQAPVARAAAAGLRVVSARTDNQAQSANQEYASDSGMIDEA